jgi:hypothetical protein
LLRSGTEGSNLAAAQGDKTAAKNRDAAAAKMTPDQLAEGRVGEPPVNFDLNGNHLDGVDMLGVARHAGLTR